MRNGQLFGRRMAPFDPPLFSESQRRAFAKLDDFMQVGVPPAESFLFDAEFGWCPPRSGSLGSKTFDEWGARLAPESVGEHSTPGLRRIVTVGCSFTLGDEVDDEQTWPYLLDAGDDALEVVNLAMSAYGLDQARLRYLRDGAGRGADEVWLGWLPAVSPRLGTLFRPVVRHWSEPVLFKPRYRPSADGLELIPNPARRLEHVHELLTSQAAFFEALATDDLWVSRVPAAYAPLGSSAWHHSGLGRTWLTLQESRARAPEHWLESEGSEIRELVLRVIVALHDDVERDGARFRLLVLPDRDGLVSLAGGRRGYWFDVADELRARGVEVIDLSAACLAAGMAEDDEAWQAGGHYSPRSNSVIAATLEAR